MARENATDHDQLETTVHDDWTYFLCPTCGEEHIDQDTARACCTPTESDPDVEYHVRDESGDTLAVFDTREEASDYSFENAANRILTTVRVQTDTDADQ